MKPSTKRLTLQPRLITDQHRRGVRDSDRGSSPRRALLVIGTHIATLHAASRLVIGTKGHPQVPITSISGTKKIRDPWPYGVIIGAMLDADGNAVLEIVDRVLGDLALRDRMFVGRRPEAGESATIVIQTGEEGRHRLALPELGSEKSIETFIADAQAHLSEVFGHPVPRCPRHDHALVGEASGDEIAWVCPDGEWRCALGDYEECTWPPELDAGNMAAVLSGRIRRRGIAGVRRVGVSRRDGEWVAQLGIWPIDDALIKELRTAAAPIAVEVEPEDWGPADAGQKALDRRLAEELEWARWAVDRWAEFPVELVPRPLVLVGQRSFVEGEFRSGETKEAFIYGLFEAGVQVPGPVLALLPPQRERTASRRRPAPLVITGAARSETEFWTDRGRRMLPAWRLQSDGLDSAIWVLDPEVASLAWVPREPPATPRPALQTPRGDPGARAVLGPDDHTLTFSFTGALPRYEHYPRAEVIESRQAVAIVPVAKDVGPPGPRILPGYGHKVVVHLGQPLGARVFVDLHGNPGEVNVSQATTGAIPS